MARKTGLFRSASGLYIRNLGWKATPNGYAQHKFYLGRDPDEARSSQPPAGATLEAGGGSLAARERWLAAAGQPRQISEGGGITTLTAVGLAIMRTSDRPVWDETTLAIAEAVRNGEPVARLAVPTGFQGRGRSAVTDWINRLQDDITVVKVELADEAAQRAVEECQEIDGQRLMDMARRRLQKRISGETLFAALDAYRKWIEAQYVEDGQLTAWGGAQRR